MLHQENNAREEYMTGFEIQTSAIFCEEDA